MEDKLVKVTCLGRKGAPKHLVGTLSTGATIALAGRGDSVDVLSEEADSPELVQWERLGWVSVAREAS